MASDADHRTFSPLKVFEHPLSSTALFPLLRNNLPYSLPLYRRLQHPSRTPNAHILSTLPFRPPGEKDLPTCFAITYVDRSARPETEMWAFLSGEHPLSSCKCRSTYATALDHTSRSGSSDTSPADFPPTPGSDSLDPAPCARALLSILQHVRGLPFPALSAESEEDAMSAVRALEAQPERSPGAEPHSTTFSYRPASDYTAALHSPAKVLLGSSSYLATAGLAACGCVRRDLPGVEHPHRKYVFRLARLRELGLAGGGGEGDEREGGGGRRLPPGLRWGRLRERDFALVRSRSSIPRRDATLRECAGVAVFEEGDRQEEDNKEERAPVAWAFVAKDGSLKALHVEPPFRGKGVAKAVGARVMCLPLVRRDTGKGEGRKELELDEEEDGLAHADVAVGNVASERVCEALGGEDLWRSWWVRVDLDRVGDIFGG